MLSLLIQKELKNIIQSPKFTATFLVTSVLIVISIYLGIQEYKSSVQQYQANKQIVQQDTRRASSWGNIRNIAHREPEPLQIFASGLHFDIGRLSSISTVNDVKLTRSPYSDETLFAIFRFIDFTFIVQIVLSLFAILFTYNAINGERETGTLKLSFANSLPRAKYLAGKFSGIGLGLMVPLLIPMILGLLMVAIFNIQLSSGDWIRILTLYALSLVYVAFFIGIGLLVSSLTRSSSLSFLLLLVFWIGTVLIIPRTGVVAAGQLMPVESIAEIEAKQQAFERIKWDEHASELAEVWRARQQQMEDMAEDEARTYRESKQEEWSAEDEQRRNKLRQEIIDNNRKLIEENLNKKRQQQKLAFSIARISPASSYLLAAMNLAGTDIEMKNRYQQSMRVYRDEFEAFVEKKQKEAGQQGGFRISITNDGVSIDTGRDDTNIDASQLPEYQAPEITIAGAVGNSLMDFALITILTILTFGGTFVSFTRYDMR